MGTRQSHRALFARKLLAANGAEWPPLNRAPARRYGRLLVRLLLLLLLSDNQIHELATVVLGYHEDGGKVGGGRRIGRIRHLVGPLRGGLNDNDCGGARLLSATNLCK
jgi:hypothetical protein